MATSTIEDYGSDQDDGKIIFAALDLGTSFSGWAFALRSDLDRNANIYVKSWYSPYNAGATGKTSTCALINPDGTTLHTFGFDAERRYEELVREKRHEPYYYFKNFKTGLYGNYYQSWTSSMKLLDQMGKVLPAINVFSASIKFLAEDMYTDLKKRVQDIRREDIKWIITVPAIWTDQAKYLMRESAIRAGLSSNSIIIALEPEVGSLYCRQLDICAVNRQSDLTLSSLPIGSKYLVLDAGGGTIDLTIHEIVSEKCVKQVVAATGNIYGGNAVNDEFENYLKSILSCEIYDNFKHKETEDWLLLMAELEIKKKLFDPKQPVLSMRFPSSLAQLYKSNTRRSSFFKFRRKTKNLEVAFRELDIDTTLHRDKLNLPSHVFLKFFQRARDMVITEIKQVLKEVHGGNISCIIMVGGFSECILLQQTVMSEFDLPLIVPVEASTAVLKGAVLYGYHPSFVSERVVKYTYGVSSCEKFVPGVHPIEKYTTTDNGVVCKDIFNKFVTCGQVVKNCDSQYSKRYVPTHRKQDNVIWYICASKNPNPMYITDNDCHVIGKVVLKLPDTDDARNNQLYVTFAFGGTEIIVTAKELKTGRKVKVEANFLE